MPELKNCRRCNKVFSFVAGLPICPSCTREDERIFDEVSMYIRDNPGVPLTVVSKELKISYDKLMKYVKEGRLQIRSESGAFYKFCEKCGEMIMHGKFCKKCERHISTVLDVSKKSLQDKIMESERNKGDYRFLAHDKDEKK
ncbi:MAG: MerR family transcriptional regulator [Oscillospiraceae bacterium]|nr:MerR family transcriptional regulator [Oscillospiraceae bacterium]